MTTTARIRRATPEDAERLSDLAARTFHDTFAAENTVEDMRAYMSDAFTVERQRAELLDPGMAIFLAFVDDAPAGYASVGVGRRHESVPGANAIELARLYADRSWHGRGIGRALLDECFAFARAGGFDTIWLGVWERNLRAIAFYEKSGFVRCGSLPFTLGSDHQTDLVMARAL